LSINIPNRILRYNQPTFLLKLENIGNFIIELFEVIENSNLKALLPYFNMVTPSLLIFM